MTTGIIDPLIEIKGENKFNNAISKASSDGKITQNEWKKAFNKVGTVKTSNKTIGSDSNFVTTIKSKNYNWKNYS